MDARLAQEALLDGQARFEEWARKFMADWGRSSQVEQMKMIYRQIPPEAKDALKQQDPQTYETMTRILNQKQRRPR